jgi:hypothetical protein
MTDQDSPADGALKEAGPEDKQHAARLAIITGSPLFDPDWYGAQHPEVAASGLAPALHYLTVGAASGLPPSPGFDAADYLRRYPDVARSGINPLIHYTAFGRAEGRTIRPVGEAAPPPETPPPETPPPETPPPETPPPEAPAPAAAPPATPGETAKARLIRESGLFDADWYLARHPEAAAAGLPPELHYLRHGAASGLPPSPEFDGADYLSRHRDVAASGANPLLHFLQFGRKEGRAMRPWNAQEATERLIRRSGFYDEAWFLAAYPAVASSRLTPLHYFIKHGRDHRLNPGPDFDSKHYLETYPDAAQSKLNPLVHYLEIGRPQGRAIRPAPPPLSVARPPLPNVSMPPAEPTPEDIALIAASPLFDKAWYLNKYPEVARLGMNPAEHYLRFGFTEMRQPSVYFDPHYYLVEQSPEIAATGENPLLHYLRTGAALGRKPRALFDFVPATALRGTAQPPARILAGAAAPHATELPPPHPPRPPAADAGPVQLWAGSTLLAAGDESAFLRDRARIVAFARLIGVDLARLVRVEGSAALAEALAADSATLAFSGLGPELAGGRSRIVDAWYANDRTLRLRIGDEAPEPRPALSIRAFQGEAENPRSLALAAEAGLATAGPAFLDVALADPLMPVLLVLSDAAGSLLEIGLIAFPSLFRRGLHHAEIAGLETLADPLPQIRAAADSMAASAIVLASGHERPLVGSITVPLATAAGDERIFSAPLRAWAARVFGVAIMAAGDGQPGASPVQRALPHFEPPRQLLAHMRERHDRAAAVLRLPPDAIPTIAALAAPASLVPEGGATAPGPFYVADAASQKPRLSVVLPAAMADLRDLQPDGAVAAWPELCPAQPGAADATAPAIPIHLAIRFPRAAETGAAAMLMPLAPDAKARAASRSRNAAPAPPLRVVVRAASAARLEQFLAALGRQAGAAIASVVVETHGGELAAGVSDEVLARHVPRIGRTIAGGTPGRLRRAMLDGDGGDGVTLVADDRVVLYDPDTVASLLALAAAQRVATASCVLLRDTMSRKGSVITFESGGCFPSHVSLLAAPRLVLAEPDIRDAIPAAAYPVLANGAGLLMLRDAALAEVLGAADEIGHIEFALKAVARGYRHLCTSGVRAAFLAADARVAVTDPPGTGAVPGDAWPGILARVTLVRELA